MSIFLRLEQKNFKTRETAGKWYAKATPLMTAHTEDLAQSISDSATFTKADVEGVITALVDEMKRRLQDGQKVVLDDFGSFYIAVHSDGVDNPDAYDLEAACAQAFLQVYAGGAPQSAVRPTNRAQFPGKCEVGMESSMEGGT